MREIVFGANMAITFDRDGSELEFSADADGPDAVFVAGQTTDNSHCSFGCHQNFWEFDQRKAG